MLQSLIALRKDLLTPNQIYVLFISDAVLLNKNVLL